MFNVCPGCGRYSVDKRIVEHGPYAVCKRCGYRHKFVRLPLFVVTGASGTGKTTVLLQLASQLTNAVCLDSDILWRDEFNKPEDDYREFRNMWLRNAKNIAQAGRPVVLFGSSTPGQFEKCEESVYFSKIIYLALVCNDDVIEERLKARPAWRKSGAPEVLLAMRLFNNWLKENAEFSDPRMMLLDTSTATVEETVTAVKAWINKQLKR